MSKIDEENVATEIKTQTVVRQQQSRKQKCLSSQPINSSFCQRDILTVWRPRSLQNTNVRKLYENKLLSGHTIVNRCALTPKQHIKLLADPKKLMYDPHTLKPLLKPTMGCSPRIAQLSVPKRQSLFHTWTNFKYCLTPGKLDKLYERLAECKAQLNMTDAHMYFQKLRKADPTRFRRQRKRHRKSSLSKTQTKDELKEIILYDAIVLSKVICGSGLPHLNQMQKNLSQGILEKLVKYHQLNAVPSRLSKDEIHRLVLHASDNCASIITGILFSADLQAKHLEELQTFESTSTLSIESVEKEPDKKQILQEEEEEEIISEVEEESEETDDFEFESLSEQDFQREIMSTKASSKASRKKSRSMKRRKDLRQKLTKSSKASKREKMSIRDSKVSGKSEKISRKTSIKSEKSIKSAKSDALSKKTSNGIEEWGEDGHKEIGHFEEWKIYELLGLLQEYYKKQGEDPTMTVFQSPSLPDTTIQNMLENVRLILETTMHEDEYSKLQHAWYTKITEYVTEIDAKALDPQMQQLICSVSALLARAEMEESSVQDFATLMALGEPEDLSPEELMEYRKKRAKSLAKTKKTAPKRSTFSTGEDEKVEEGGEEIIHDSIVQAEIERTEEEIEAQAIALAEEEVKRIETVGEEEIVEEDVMGVSDVLVTEDEELEGEELKEQTTEEKELEGADAEEKTIEGEEVESEELKEKTIEEEEEEELEGEEFKEQTLEEEELEDKDIKHAKSVGEEGLEEELEGEEMMGSMEEETKKVGKEKQISEEEDEQMMGEEKVVTFDREKKVVGLDGQEINIMPHSPDMVCCASVKAWAAFISDVARNSMNWCCWIDKTIRTLRDISCVLRGDFTDGKGEILTIDPQKWTRYSCELHCRIERWQMYNNYVENISDQIINCYRNKRVECCELCAQENVDYTILGIEHLCTELIEALRSTQYWRNWLNNMITECQSLSRFLTERESSLTLTNIISETTLNNDTCL